MPRHHHGQYWLNIHNMYIYHCHCLIPIIILGKCNNIRIIPRQFNAATAASVTILVNSQNGRFHIIGCHHDNTNSLFPHTPLTNEWVASHWQPCHITITANTEYYAAIISRRGIRHYWQSATHEYTTSHKWDNRIIIHTSQWHRQWINGNTTNGY